jgi:ABC-type bacteriocin/lantibiotic exporter with double-glycine peptidase domain
MQIKINILILAGLVRMVGGLSLGVLLWLSAREIEKQDLRVALLIAMSYIMTVAVYRMVRIVKMNKEMEKFLEDYLDNEDKKL